MGNLRHFYSAIFLFLLVALLSGCSSSNSGNPTGPGGNSGPELSSPVFNQGQTYSHTFTKVGTFPYHCGVHPSMKGTVTVQAGGTATQVGTAITNFAFENLTVSVGSTVTWTNDDSAPHSVISD